jgi:calcineurin-like phosphoesterase family protein
MNNEILNIEKVFITSDSHYFHTNIIKYCDRPFKDVIEMNQELVKRWNNVIDNDTIVFHLGDFCLGRTDTALHILNSLNGKIYFIKGNHDKTVLAKSYTKKRFEWIKDDYEFYYNDIHFLLTHRPLCSLTKNTIVLHGHVHKRTNILEKHGSNILLDIGVDAWNFTPISLEKIIHYINDNNK